MEIISHIRRIADAVNPIIADADTGYGGPLNVVRFTVTMKKQDLLHQIEDQHFDVVAT